MDVGVGLDGVWVGVVEGVGSFVSNGLVVEGVGVGLDGVWVGVVEGVGSFVSNGLVVEGVGVCGCSVFSFC